MLVLNQLITACCIAYVPPHHQWAAIESRLLLSCTLTKAECPAGTLVISATEEYLYLHKVVLDPTPGLQQIMCTATSTLAHGQQHFQCGFQAAAWSPDGSAVLLDFVIQDCVCGDALRVRRCTILLAACLLLNAVCTFSNTCGPAIVAEDAPSWLRPVDSQAVYLLEMATHELQLLRPAEPASGSRSMSFTPDNRQLITTSCIDGMTLDFWVADRNGQSHPQFAVQAQGRQAWANITHGRIAVAEWPRDGQLRLAARDLSSGQVVISRELPFLSSRGTFGLAANQGGTKLATCSWQTGAVQLYDATTLQELGCMQQMPGQVSTNRERYLVAVIWGTYGWLLSSHDVGLFGVNLLRPSQLHKLCALHVWRLQQGHTLAEVLYTGLQQQSALALSPDGAFVCTYAAAVAVLRVHDIRSGHLVLEQETGLPVIPFGITVQTRHNSFAVWWSACGRLIMIQHTCTNHRDCTTAADIQGGADVSLYILPLYL